MPDERDDRIDLLVPRTKDHDALMIGRRVRADIAEATIEGENGPPFTLTNRHDPRVSDAAEVLLENGLHVVAGSAKKRSCGFGKILVSLEPG
jgi:hypothetical protein